MKTGHSGQDNIVSRRNLTALSRRTRYQEKRDRLQRCKEDAVVRYN